MKLGSFLGISVRNSEEGKKVSRNHRKLIRRSWLTVPLQRGKELRYGSKADKM